MLTQSRRCVGCVSGGSTHPRRVPLALVLFESEEAAAWARRTLELTWASCRTWKARRVFESVPLPGGGVLALAHAPARRFPPVTGATVLEEEAVVT